MNDSLRESIKANAYKPHNNPTFTPRVLNRLPKQERRIRWILPVVYVVAFAILFCYTVYVMKGKGESNPASNRMILASIALITYGLVASILIPLLRKFSI